MCSTVHVKATFSSASMKYGLRIEGECCLFLAGAMDSSKLLGIGYDLGPAKYT